MWLTRFSPTACTMLQNFLLYRFRCSKAIILHRVPIASKLFSSFFLKGNTFMLHWMLYHSMLDSIKQCCCVFLVFTDGDFIPFYILCTQWVKNNSNKQTKSFQTISIANYILPLPLQKKNQKKKISVTNYPSNDPKTVLWLLPWAQQLWLLRISLICALLWGKAVHCMPTRHIPDVYQFTTAFTSTVHGPAYRSMHWEWEWELVWPSGKALGW